MCETFFRSPLSFSTCSFFFALETAMIHPRNVLVWRRTHTSVRRRFSAGLNLSRSLKRSHIQLNPGPHGRAQIASLDVLALSNGWLSFDHARDQHRGIFHQLVGRERNLSDRAVHESGLVSAELDFASLNFLHRLANVESNRASLRVG